MKEAFRWFLNTNIFTIIPSETENLGGDLGLRSLLNYDLDREIIYSQIEKYFFSNELRDKIKFFIFMINNRLSKPLYSSTVINNNTLEFLNFSNDILEGYSIGDKVDIYNKSNLSIIKSGITITSISGNIISFSEEIISQNVERYKVVNTEGYLYYLVDIQTYIETINLNSKKRFSTKIYANI